VLGLRRRRLADLVECVGAEGDLKEVDLVVGRVRLLLALVQGLLEARLQQGHGGRVEEILVVHVEVGGVEVELEVVGGVVERVVVVVVVAEEAGHLRAEVLQVGLLQLQQRLLARLHLLGLLRGAGRGAAADRLVRLLGLLARPVLVVRVLLEVEEPEPLGLVHERPAPLGVQLLPAGAQPLTDLGVVHLGRHLADPPALDLRPDHEGVHWPLHVVAGVLLALGGVGVGRGRDRVDVQRSELLRLGRALFGGRVRSGDDDGRVGGAAVARSFRAVLVGGGCGRVAGERVGRREDVGEAGVRGRLEQVVRVVVGVEEACEGTDHACLLQHYIVGAQVRSFWRGCC